MIKVLITDDHPVVRRGIRMILEQDDQKRFGRIEEAGSGAELLKRLQEDDFSIVILDISLPGRSGLELLKDIRKGWPSVPVIILSMHPEEQYALKSLQAGAAAYLTKDCAIDELIPCIAKVSEGGRYITRSIAEMITIDFLDDRKKTPGENLTPRELEVVSLLASGKTLSSIAKELSLSPKTISTYRERILTKLNLKTSSDIIRYAFKEGLVQ